MSVARQALAVADLVCFAGPRPFAAMRAKPHGVDASRLHAFGTACKQLVELVGQQARARAKPKEAAEHREGTVSK